ncbi:MAG: peroxiredoxin, partial [Candidatus Puniceispirillaceae bacterium]
RASRRTHHHVLGPRSVHRVAQHDDEARIVLQDEFDAANCGVIGISKDTPAKQAKFRAKHGLTCLLGADDTTDICEQFGVWVEKSMYGKAYMGIQRASFVIDEQGMIAAVWPKVKVPGHAEEVLAFVTSE